MDAITSTGIWVITSLAGQDDARTLAADGVTESVCRLLELTLELYQQREDKDIKEHLGRLAGLLNPTLVLGQDCAQAIRTLVTSTRRLLKALGTSSEDSQERAASVVVGGSTPV